MRRFWSWLGLNLGKHWIAVMVVGGLLTVGLGYGTTKLKFSTDQSNYLNKSDQVYKDNVAYQKLFGGEAMLTLITMEPGHTVAELFTAGDIAQWSTTARSIDASNRVLNTVTPLTAMQWNDKLVKSPNGDVTQSVAGKLLTADLGRDTSKTGQAARTKSALATIQRINAIPVAQRVLTNPKYIDFLLYDNPLPSDPKPIRTPLLPFFPDARHAQMVVRLQGNQSIKDEGKAADLITATANKMHFDHASMVTTGAPALLENLNNYLTGGMTTLALIAIAIMAAILLLLFRVRWRLLPLGIVLIGVIWAFGAAGYLGIPLTIVTISGLPVMLGIGIDYAIQMHARVEEEVVVSRADHPIQETARNLGPALLVVTIDAILAFAALHYAKVPMLREFGLLLIIGVTAICLNSIMGTLAILGIREYRSPTKGVDFTEGFLGRLTVRLGSITDRVAPALAVASLVIFAGGLLVEGKLVLQTDPTQWVNQKSQVIKNLNVLDREVHSSSELGVYVQAGDAFAQPSVDFVDQFTRAQLKKYPDTLLTASGLVTTVSQLSDVPGASHLIPTSAQVRSVYATAPRDIKLSTVAPSGQRDEHHLPDRTERPRLACQGRSRDPQDRASAGQRQGHAVGSRRRRGRAPRQSRGEPRDPHVRRDPVRVPVPLCPPAQRHPRLAVARAGADRSGRIVVVRLRPRSQAEPDDRGGRSTGGRGLHRVHVADPVAFRRGTRARHDAETGDGCRRLPHRPRVHRLGAHCDRRRRGHRHVVVAAAARLRSARGAQRHRSRC